MANKFSHRSTQNELLDSGNVPVKLLVRNLREMDFLNRFGGGHAISLEGIRMLVNDKNKQYHIADLGCGSGDSLKYFARWARKNGFNLKFTGIDKNPDAINYLKVNCRNFPEIEGVVSDYNLYLNQINRPDIVHCSLFCHHLGDNELMQLFEKMISNTGSGFVLNDLQRNRRAYYAVKLMTTVLRGSSLAKHDGPVSVLRGFRKRELEKTLQVSGVNNYRIYRRRGFRFLVVAQSHSK